MSDQKKMTDYLEVRDAFLRYGTHTSWCGTSYGVRYDGGCACGFTQTLRAVRNYGRKPEKGPVF